jgi:hypothetical protein
MAARRLFIAAVLPIAALAYACGSGGEGVPPGFDLGMGSESKTGGFGANGGTSAPGPSFGIPTGGREGNGDGGTTEGGTDAKTDSAPADTKVTFDTAGLDANLFDTGPGAPDEGL